MNRNLTAIYRIYDRRNDDFVPGTPEDRMGLVWPLTREITSLSRPVSEFMSQKLV